MKEVDLIVIGKITKQIEKETHGRLQSGDICIDNYHLETHIPLRHQKELDQLGIGPLDYVKYIVANYTEIRKGQGKSYLLIAAHWSENLKNIAAITLEYIGQNNDNHFWEVRTAQPRSRDRMEKRELIWKK